MILSVDGVGVDGDFCKELMEQTEKARVADTERLLDERRV